MSEIQRNTWIIEKFHRLCRIKQIVKGNFNPFAGICPQYQRFRTIIAAQGPVSIFQRDKKQAVRVMITIAIIRDIPLYRSNFIFADNGIFSRARRKRQDAVFAFAQGFQVFDRMGMRPEDSPKAQPRIIDSAKVVEIISRCVFFSNPKVEGFGNTNCLRGGCR